MSETPLKTAMDDMFSNLGDQSISQPGDAEVITKGSDAGKTVGQVRAEVFGGITPEGVEQMQNLPVNGYKDPGMASEEPVILDSLGLPAVAIAPKVDFIKSGLTLEETKAAAIARIGDRLGELKKGMRGHLEAFPEAYSDRDRALHKLRNDMPLTIEEEGVADAEFISQINRTIAGHREFLKKRARRGRAHAKGASGKKVRCKKK